MHRLDYKKAKKSIIALPIVYHFFTISCFKKEFCSINFCPKTDIFQLFYMVTFDLGTFISFRLKLLAITNHTEHRLMVIIANQCICSCPIPKYEKYTFRSKNGQKMTKMAKNLKFMLTCYLFLQWNVDQHNCIIFINKNFHSSSFYFRKTPKVIFCTQSEWGIQRSFRYRPSVTASFVTLRFVFN